LILYLFLEDFLAAGFLDALDDFLVAILFVTAFILASINF
jgi:hypothetical protein